MRMGLLGQAAAGADWASAAAERAREKKSEKRNVAVKGSEAPRMRPFSPFRERRSG
jgi:hypothetical protein